MRGSNQIVALTECRETLESEKFQDARQFVSAVLPVLLKDPDMLKKLEDPYLPTELRPASNVANFFESMGAFVRFAGLFAHTPALRLRACGASLRMTRFS